MSDDNTKANLQNVLNTEKNFNINTNENKIISIRDLSDNEISNLLGQNVEVTLNIPNRAEEEKAIKVKGNIFSILKSNNFLIILRRDEKELNSINSYLINIENVQNIELSDENFEVKFFCYYFYF
jgi:hypothetical protein